MDYDNRTGSPFPYKDFRRLDMGYGIRTISLLQKQLKGFQKDPKAVLECSLLFSIRVILKAGYDNDNKANLNITIATHTN